MFENIISTLQFQSDEPVKSKRRHERRSVDHCVTVIDGKTYPVQDWSEGGVLVFGDSKPFALNGEVGMTMKFKLRDDMLDIEHRAKVVRKTNNNVALEFVPLTKKIHKAFQSVIEDYVTAQFVDSQQAT
jgi:hypothetical protein